MAQVLSTFSRLEQSRFEAFRRAVFPRDAIARYVAHCLIEEQHQPLSRGVSAAASSMSKPNSSQPDVKRPRREPILSEVVAPGQAEDIAIVVSTLAKAYAQRLVTAARRHAANRTSAAAAAPSETPDAASTLFATPTKVNEYGVVSAGKSPRKRIANTGATATTRTTSAPSAILPEDLLAAFQERQAQGLDPGFFLQPSSQTIHNYSVHGSSSSNNSNGSNLIYQQKRLAALHAQEQYDKLHGGPPPSEDEAAAAAETGSATTASEANVAEEGKNGFEDDEVVPMDTSSPGS